MAQPSDAVVSLLITVLPLTLNSTTPVLLAGLGELYAEKAGILNFGLEGIMLIGASVGFLTTLFTGSIVMGFLGVIVSGVGLGLIISYLVINMRVNQIVLAIGIFLLGPGVSSFLVSSELGLFRGPSTVAYLKPLDLPFIGGIPIVGAILNQNILVFFTLALIPFTWILLNRTKFGLKLRAVGEDPWAADAMGVNVFRFKYLAVVVSSVLSSLGGAFLILAQSGVWIDNVTAGRGFVAVAALRVGAWTPQGTFLASLLYGVVDALQFRLQILSIGVPFQLLQSLPYIAGIIILTLSSLLKSSSQPKSLGVPYWREERNIR